MLQQKVPLFAVFSIKRIQTRRGLRPLAPINGCYDREKRDIPVETKFHVHLVINSIDKLIVP